MNGRTKDYDYHDEEQRSLLKEMFSDSTDGSLPPANRPMSQYELAEMKNKQSLAANPTVHSTEEIPTLRKNTFATVSFKKLEDKHKQHSSCFSIFYGLMGDKFTSLQQSINGIRVNKSNVDSKDTQSEFELERQFAHRTKPNRPKSLKQNFADLGLNQKSTFLSEFAAFFNAPAPSSGGFMPINENTPSGKYFTELKKQLIQSPRPEPLETYVASPKILSRP